MRPQVGDHITTDEGRANVYEVTATFYENGDGLHGRQIGTSELTWFSAPRTTVVRRAAGQKGGAT